MIALRLLVTLLAIALIGTEARAQDAVVVGQDTYVSATNAALKAPAGRDAFLSGFSVDVTQKVEKDVGAAAFDLDISAPIGGDAYLAGASVDVDQAISEDLTAAGFSVQVGQNAVIGGNARIAAGTTTIDGQIAGSVVASTGTFSLNGQIGGDARLVVGSMSFGPNAKIAGRLTYLAAEPISIPATVADPARITFQQITAQEGFAKARETLTETAPGFWWARTGAVLALTFAISIAFLIALSAALLAFMPERIETLRSEAIRSPVRAMALGVLGLSMSIGLVPVSAMTLIGIPLIPIAILAAIVFWILGYIIGTYALTTRMLEAYRGQPLTLGAKLLALILGFVVFALLNFIPVIGWLINLMVVFLGLGSLIIRAARTIAQDGGAPVATSAIEKAAQPEPIKASRRGRN